MSKNIRKFYKDGRKAWALTHVSAVVGLEDYVKEHGGGGGGGEEQRIEALETKMTQAETDIGVLQAAYEGLTQSDIVVVQDHMDVTSPEPNTIYRETGVSSYQDWMYYNNDWYLMAEYDNAIDDVPTEGSNNLVKSGGVKTELDKKANIDGSYDSMAVGAAKTLIGTTPETSIYTFRRTGGGAIGEPVARLTEIQGNTGVVNQLMGSTPVVTHNGITVTLKNNSNIYILRGTASSTYCNFAQLYPRLVVGHKYLQYSTAVANPNNIDKALLSLLNQGVGSNPQAIFTAASTASGWGINNTTLGVDYTGVEILFKIIDLTLEYGAGNEPGTVAEFEARIWRDYGKTLDEYVAYTTGNLINCKAVALENVGQNQWDEEMEDGGYDASGNKTISTANLRSKNFIDALPNTVYYIQAPRGTSSYIKFLWYDNSKQLISLSSYYYGGSVLAATPSNCRYMTFFLVKNYYSGTTYQNDICINLSDAAINGTYRPYKKEIVNLNLTTLTGINPTTGVRETIFPNGMRSKGDVRDVISGNTATVKIGDPTQEAPLENTVLATPIIYTDIQYADGTPFVLPTNFEVQNDGTEKITHAEGEDSIAPVMSSIYGLDAVGKFQDMPHDYTSQATLDGLLSTLSGALGGTLTKTWDATNEKWTFSFTPNS